MSSGFKGPIRWKGFIPLAIIVGGVAVFFIFFFDWTIKFVIEKYGSQANGGKIDVASVHTSFLNADFQLKGLQVTNSSEPMKNMVELDSIHFQFLFGPLFRKKIVIKDMSIEGLRYGTQRKTSGYIPVKPKPKPTGPTITDQLMAGFNEGMKSKMKDSSLENLQGLFQGGNLTGKIQTLGENSFSNKKFKEVEGLINSSSDGWKKAVNDLPSEGTAKDLQNKIVALTQSKPKSVDEIGKILQQADGLKKEVASNLDKVKSAQQTITGDVTKVSSAVGSIDQAIEQDIQAARNQLKIPSINMKDLTPMLLGPKFESYLNKGAYWLGVAEKYMPKKSAKNDLVTEHPRKKGVDIHFGAERAYPTFLLEHAGISSAATTNPENGNLRGDLVGVNTDPPVYGKPTEAKLQGDIPSAKMSGLLAHLIFDHTGQVARDSAKIALASFPLENSVLSDAKEFQLGIEKATGRFNMDAGMSEGKLDVKADVTMSGVQYRSGSSIKELDGILKKILASISTFQLHARLSGPFAHLDTVFSSDLGEKIAAGIQNEFRAQIQAINDRIKKEIEAQVAGKKKELQAKFDQAKNQALQPLESRVKAYQDTSKVADNVRAQLDKQKNDFIKNQASGQIQKGVQDLKKKVKIPGF